jgi:hypothetical protein
VDYVDRERPETWPLEFYERGRLRAWPDDFLERVAGQLATVRDVTIRVAFASLMVKMEIERRGSQPFPATLYHLDAESAA